MPAFAEKQKKPPRQPRAPTVEPAAERAGTAGEQSLALALHHGYGGGGLRVQRACACGGSCAKCRGEKDDAPAVQPRLGASPQAAPATIPAAVRAVASAPGQPLDAAARRYMEPRFGRDFGHVRVHTGPRADEAAAAIDARAFTLGRHLAFRAGEYAPESDAGRRLLAHELTHVVQQQAGVRLKDAIGQPGDVYEREADAAADSVSQGAAAFHGSSGGAPSGNGNAVVLQRSAQASSSKRPQPDPGAAFRTPLQAMLAKKQEAEAINGALAKQLAHAYVNRPEVKQPQLFATPYTADKAQAGPGQEPSEKQVYEALVGVLDIMALPSAGSAAQWTWVPAPAEKKGERDNFWVESGRYVFSDYVGGTNPTDIAISKGKEYAFKYSAKWLKKRGLMALAGMVTGTGAILGFFEFLCATMELVILLSKPEKQEMSKDDMIVADVKRWVARETGADEAARKAIESAAATKASREAFFNYKTGVAPAVSTRVGR